MFNLNIRWADEQMITCDPEYEGTKVFLGFAYAYNRSVQRSGIWNNTLKGLELKKKLGQHS